MTRRRRLVLGALAAVLAGWVALVAFHLLSAAGDARSGKHDARSARSLAAEDPTGAEPVAAFARARSNFAAARRHLRSAVVSPLRAVPILGRQIRAADALVGTAARAAAISVDALSEAQAVLEGASTTGPARVRLLLAIADVAARARARLEPVRLPPTRELVGPLADAYDDLTRELDDLRTGLDRGRAGAEALARLVEGGRYLVLAANNAEMRSGSGMFLSAGTVTGRDGTLQLSEFRPTFDLVLPPGAVGIDGDLEARWGWLQPNADWRNLGVSPRFDVSAPLAAKMWVATGAAPVDGVLALDPVALRAVLVAVGPVRLGGGELTADNVVPYLMHDQYVEFATDDPFQSARREQLGNVAAAIMTALEDRPWRPEDLGRELAAAARGRHLLAWSSDPVQQQGWAAAGVDGSVDADSLLVAVLNRGGNKLDQFLIVQADLELAPRTDGAVTDGILRLRFWNEAPAGEPPYIAGPDPFAGLADGAYGGLLAVTLPGAARNSRVDGDDRLAVAGADGPTRVIASAIVIPRGEARSVVVHFELPAGSGTLRVEPSARVPTIQWKFGRAQWSDGESRQVRW